jgi:hypothetical protein
MVRPLQSCTVEELVEMLNEEADLYVDKKSSEEDFLRNIHLLLYCLEKRLNGK